MRDMKQLKADSPVYLLICKWDCDVMGQTGENWVCTVFSCVCLQENDGDTGTEKQNADTVRKETSVVTSCLHSFPIKWSSFLWAHFISVFCWWPLSLYSSCLSVLVLMFLLQPHEMIMETVGYRISAGTWQIMSSAGAIPPLTERPQLVLQLT